MEYKEVIREAVINNKCMKCRELNCHRCKFRCNVCGSLTATKIWDPAIGVEMCGDCWEERKWKQ